MSISLDTHLHARTFKLNPQMGYWEDFLEQNEVITFN